MAIKKIEIISLELTNFKGATHFKLEPNGADIDIYGKNGAGKTTIYDAFIWCLFHKDSKDKEKFEWEPKEGLVDELAGTSVNLILNVNGTVKKFTKEVVKKKMTRSNTIKKEPAYYVDDLKLKTKTAYDEKVAELIDKDTFKYLTNGSYFMDILKADERRETLFKYFGSKSDEEIISLYPELNPLLELIGKRDPNEAKELLQQKKVSLEKAIKELPTQIKGIRAALPDINEIDETKLNKEKTDLLIAIDKEEQDLLAIKNGSAVTEKKSAIKIKQSELTIAENEYSSSQKKATADLEDKRSDLRIKYREVEFELANAKEDIRLVESEIKENEEYIKRLESELANYSKELDAIDKRVFDYPDFVAETFDEHQLSCPTCKRAWEIEDQEEMKENFESNEKARLEKHQSEREKALVAFNETNDSEYNRIVDLGNEASKDVEQFNEKLADLRNVLDSKKDTSELEKQLSDIQKEGEVLKQQIKQITDGLLSFDESKECKEIKKDIESLEKEVEELNQAVESKADEKQKLIYDLKTIVRSIDEKMAVLNEYNRQLSVIDTLIEQEKALSAEKGETEAKILLFEEFFIKKVGLLEENVNQHFNFIQFKLFDYYDNGNLNESICEPVLKKVNYRDMSNGEQIKARIDICDTLMRAEGIYVPLFLDNAEGLTEAFETETQLIALNASKEDDGLRVTTVKTKEEAAA